MRKYASNFEETAYLAEFNEDYENREKYSMGAGYYLGEYRHSGWIIKKVPVYNRERTIEDLHTQQEAKIIYISVSPTQRHQPTRQGKVNAVVQWLSIQPKQ